MILKSHQSDVTWTLRRLKSMMTELFIQELVQTNTKENNNVSLCSTEKKIEVPGPS